MKTAYALVSVCLFCFSAAATPSTEETTFLYIKDHLGSIRSVQQQATGDIIEVKSYYPFGKEMPGKSIIAGGATQTNEGYSGEATESNIGVKGYSLSYYGARYLDTELGRWNRRDPLESENIGINPYHLVMNNPIMYRDIGGLQTDRETAERYIENLKELGFDDIGYIQDGDDYYVYWALHSSDPDANNSYHYPFGEPPLTDYAVPDESGYWAQRPGGTSMNWQVYDAIVAGQSSRSYRMSRNIASQGGSGFAPGSAMTPKQQEMASILRGEYGGKSHIEWPQWHYRLTAAVSASGLFGSNTIASEAAWRVPTTMMQVGQATANPVTMTPSVIRGLGAIGAGWSVLGWALTINQIRQGYKEVRQVEAMME